MYKTRSNGGGDQLRGQEVMNEWMNEQVYRMNGQLDKWMMAICVPNVVREGIVGSYDSVE